MEEGDLGEMIAPEPARERMSENRVEGGGAGEGRERGAEGTKAHEHASKRPEHTPTQR